MDGRGGQQEGEEGEGVERKRGGGKDWRGGRRKIGGMKELREGRRRNQRRKGRKGRCERKKKC